MKNTYYTYKNGILIVINYSQERAIRQEIARKAGRASAKKRWEK